MPSTLIRAQLNPAASTLTTLYTVPSATSTIIASIKVCNRSVSPTAFRIAKRLLGSVISDEMYLYYDAAIGGNTTLVLCLGEVAIATDIISVYATAATVSFNLSAQELT